MPLKVIHRPVWHYLILLLVLIFIALFFFSLLLHFIFQILSLNFFELWEILYLDLILYPIIALFLIRFLWKRFINVTPTASTTLYQWNDGPWLHYIGDPKTSITINWITKERSKTQIRFGLNTESMSIIEGVIGKIHRITINDLKPDTQYVYEIVGFKNGIDTDKIHSFRTAPDEIKPFKFIVVGDTQNGGGFGDNSWAYPKLVDAFVKKDFDLMIHTGDATDQGNDLKSWHQFFQASLPFSVSKPMHIVAGNHDTGTNCLTDKTQKKLPDEGANYDYLLGYDYEGVKERRITPFKDRYFSFDYSNCRFLFIDTQNSKMAEKNSNQWFWLEEKLTNIPKHYWIIAILHRAPIELKENSEGNYYLKEEKFGSYILPILLKHHVKLILTGHAHIFQSMIIGGKYPVYYVISGGAGNELRRNNPILAPELKKLGIIYREDSSHYLLVEVKGNEIEIAPFYPDNTSMGGQKYILNRLP